MNNNASTEPTPTDDDMGAWEAYFDQVSAMVYKHKGAEEQDLAILEMASDYFGDGSDPLHLERASSRIVDSLGL